MSPCIKQKNYRITTKDLTRLTIREADRAATIMIDGRKLRVKARPVLRLEKLAYLSRARDFGRTEAGE